MTDEMRVAVTLEHCWHRIPGGTARAAALTIAALAEHGGVSLVGVAAAHREPAPLALRSGVPVHQSRLPRPLLYDAWHHLGRPAVERLTGAVDVVWAPAMAVPAARAPVVATVHDLAFLDDPGLATRRGRRFFTRSVEVAKARASIVVCPSEATRDACIRFGFDAERLRVVPWGLRAPVATSSAVEQARERHGLEGPFVLWVGTVEPRKNLPVLIEAWRMLRRRGTAVPLVLVGPGGWGPEIDEIIGGDARDVVVTGFVGDDELRALYRAAAVFCYPSLAEGFGLPVLEAMAQGTPVVTSAGTATEEVLGADGAAGFAVDPQQPAAVAEALATLLADPQRREAAARCAAARAAELSPEQLAGGMVAAFEDAVRVGARSGPVRAGRVARRERTT